MPPRTHHLALLLLALAVLPACRATGRAGPYAPQSESYRDALRAQELTQQAAAIIDSKPEKAEKLLLDALAADLYHGPAHNNLGVLFLNQNKLYEAAGEFEWARKLMPGHPDPRLNLALTLERAGRTSEALETYAAALDAAPEHIHTIQALTKLQLRLNQPSDLTQRHLAEIALRGSSQPWRDWARLQLARSSAP